MELKKTLLQAEAYSDNRTAQLIYKGAPTASGKIVLGTSITTPQVFNNGGSYFDCIRRKYLNWHCAFTVAGAEYEDFVTATFSFYNKYSLKISTYETSVEAKYYNVQPYDSGSVLNRYTQVMLPNGAYKFSVEFTAVTGQVDSSVIAS